MRDQDEWAAHAEFMDALAVQGAIVLGGPVGAGDRRFLHIFEADSADAVVTHLAGDPWTAAAVLETESVEPWQVLLRAPALRPGQA